MNVLFTNLQGIVSADQINPLVSSLLLDENGLFVFELAPTPVLDDGQRLLQLDGLIPDEVTAPIDGCLPDLGSLLPFRRRARELGQEMNDYLKENHRRRLQLDIFGDVLANLTLDDIIDTEDILVINEINADQDYCSWIGQLHGRATSYNHWRLHASDSACIG